nr:DnaB-like helicase N-terminal domain-containing protein [Blautia sp. AF34-10]
MEEALIKRILPHSIEAEQSVIGSMLMGREAIMAASEILTSDDFYQHQYGVIFDAWWSCSMRENRSIWSPCRTACVKRMFRRRSVRWSLSAIF